jgi:RNA recognition motif-containing protein
LFNLFNNYGTIIAIKIVRGFNNASLSYGFVVMSTEDEVRNAINYLNGVLFMGRYIKVAHAVRNELNTKRKKFKKQFINSIYVRFRCLSHNTDISESRFRSIFEQFGRVDDVSNKKDYDGSICSKYYKLLIENDKPTPNKFYEYVNNHSPLSDEKINMMINDVKNIYPNDKIYMVASPNSDIDSKEYEIISNSDVDKDLFILCNSKRSILSRSMYALTSLFFSNKKEYCYLPSWGFFVVCGLNTKYDNNNFKYIY